MSAGSVTATISPRGLEGTIDAIASKSAAHRLLILAALSDAPTQVRCATTSRDIDATIRCLRALGASVERTEWGFSVEPIPRDESGELEAAHRGATLDCGESGSTLRFMLPVACAIHADATFTGQGRLPERPLEPLRSLLVEHGCSLSPQGVWPLEAGGRMAGGEFSFAGDVSSQFATGLLLAASAMGEGVRLHLRPPVESRPYIDITRDALARFGVRVDVAETSEGLDYQVEVGSRPLSPGVVEVEGDWSNAAFWLCAGALGTRPVTVRGLDLASSQGDRAVVGILSDLGAQVSVDERLGEVTVTGSAPGAGGGLHGTTIDASDVPDLVVALSAVAACAVGPTRVVNAGRLRAKESDRLSAIGDMLCCLGVDVIEEPDGLLIMGRGVAGMPECACLQGGTVNSFNDHRIVMAAAIAATRCDSPVRIVGAQAHEKSYPGFFEDYRLMGGVVSLEEAQAQGEE